MARNSIGNVMEILDLLDKEKYTGEEIVANYQMLIDKWGEWEIVGAGAAGLVIRYVNIGKALFSGLMVTYGILTVVFVCLAVILGKILFPMLSKSYANNNDEMVDLASLKAAGQIDEIHKSKKKEEWF